MMVSNKTDLGERMRTASAGQRVTWSMLAGAVAGVVVSLVTVPSAAILAGWDVAVVIYLAWVWIAVWRLDPGTTGRLISVVVMYFNVTLFLRLLRSLLQPHKVRFSCPACGLQRHDADAVHCKACGKVLNIPDEGSVV